jgi:hypothetical protein
MAIMVKQPVLRLAALAWLGSYWYVRYLNRCVTVRFLVFVMAYAAQTCQRLALELMYCQYNVNITQDTCSYQPV